MSSFHPRSPDLFSSRGPAQGVSLSAPFGLPGDVPRAPGKPAVKEAEGITDVPSSAGERGLLPAVSLLLSEKVLGMRIIFFCLLFRQETRKLTGKDLFFLAEGGITLINFHISFWVCISKARNTFSSPLFMPCLCSETKPLHV